MTTTVLYAVRMRRSAISWISAFSRYAHFVLLPRIWRLRHNFSAYDAAYVVLAEKLSAALVRNVSRQSGHNHQFKHGNVREFNLKFFALANCRGRAEIPVRAQDFPSGWIEARFAMAKS
jgi:hypothetical protein